MQDCILIHDNRSRKLGRRFNLALRDVVGGVSSFSLWNMLAWQDIRQRYRRSVLGPFWLTITTAIFVTAIGFLYSELFNQSISEYFPFVAVGFIVWSFISTILLDSCDVFIQSEGMIKQIRQPFTIYVCRMVWRNLIVFAHNSIILVVVLIIGGEVDWLSLLSLPIAMLVLSLNGVFLGVLFGVLCSRFRDIIPIVGSVVQITFFLTPIFWKPEVVKERAWVVEYNPTHHLINIVRGPILGEGVPMESWLAVLMLSFLLMMLAIIILAAYRHKIAYWIG